MKTVFSAPSIEIKQFSRNSVITLSGGSLSGNDVDGTNLAATALMDFLGTSDDSVKKMKVGSR